MRMAKNCPAVGVVAGPHFAAALAEALRDAAGALLREIDFVGEAANLRDARAFYKFNRRIRVPCLQPSASRSIGQSLWSSSRAFRFSTLRSTTNPGAMLPGLFFDPLFSRPSESIFHADPHAGNLMVQTQKHAPLTLMLLAPQGSQTLASPNS